MPNHFHILVKEKVAGGTSLFMQKLSTAYTMYFNVKNERTGALFAGCFKATHASHDEYLKYLISYIHLNPIKIIDPAWKDTGIKNPMEAKNFLERYRYSSYSEYTKILRPESAILNISAFPEYFSAADGFENTLQSWLLYK